MTETKKERSMNLPRKIILIGGGIVFVAVAACSPQIEAEDTSLAAPFVGSWQVARPAAEGVIVNIPLSDCAAPVVITKGGADEIDTLTYASPKAEPSKMELMFFKDRTTWLPAAC